MTETVIELRYLAESQPSLCIPRVFHNITEPRIRQVFDELALGKIGRIDIKERKNEKGESFKRVYVHFEKWFWNEDAQTARRKLISGKEIKIVYDNPWFWKVSASKWAPDSHQDRAAAAQRPKAHIEFDEEPKEGAKVRDEFGRDLSLKKAHDPRKRQDEHKRQDKDQLSGIPIAPTLTRKSDNHRRQDNTKKQDKDQLSSILSGIPIAPTLTRKPQKQPEVIKECFVKVKYDPIKPPSLLKRTKPSKQLLVEEGEEVEDEFAGMSETDKKECIDLYSDI
jgi:hypothetical protein